MSSSNVFQPNLCTKGMPGASKLLFVIFPAALFYNFCKWFFSFTPRQIKPCLYDIKHSHIRSQISCHISVAADLEGDVAFDIHELVSIK